MLNEASIPPNNRISGAIYTTEPLTYPAVRPSTTKL